MSKLIFTIHGESGSTCSDNLISTPEDNGQMGNAAQVLTIPGPLGPVSVRITVNALAEMLKGGLPYLEVSALESLKDRVSEALLEKVHGEAVPETMFPESKDFMLTKDIPTIKQYNVKTQVRSGVDLAGFEAFLPQEDASQYMRVAEVVPGSAPVGFTDNSDKADLKYPVIGRPIYPEEFEEDARRLSKEMEVFEEDARRLSKAMEAGYLKAVPMELEKLSLKADSECPCGGKHERVDMIFSAFCKKCDRTLT